jgi:hypothetical protein
VFVGVWQGLLFVGLIGCACSRSSKPTPTNDGPTTLDLDKMPRPVFLDSHGDALCGGSTAIDRDGVVWRESGCENGSPPFARAGKLPPEGLLRFRAALAAVRAQPGGSGDAVAPCSEGFRAFSLFDDTQVRHWTFCTARGELVPETFEAVVAVP